MASKKTKYKNIKLEQNELTPTAIGKFESRKSSSIGTFLILGLFIGAVIFLPEISDKVNSYLNPQTGKPSDPSKPIKKPDAPEPPVIGDDNYVAFTPDLTVTNDDITVNNFVVDTTALTISYDITNNSNRSTNIEELNYYLEIFNSEGTMIERVKLADDKTLSGGAFANFKRRITTDSATTIGYISIIKKTVNDYPLVDLVSNEDGIASMVCTYANEKVTYKFKDEKLKEFLSEASFENNDTEENNLYEQNNLKVNDYNNKLGVSSTIFGYDDGYNITTSANLSESGRLYIFNADTFALDTEPKVVKFEIEAQGFKCEE